MQYGLQQLLTKSKVSVKLTVIIVLNVYIEQYLLSPQCNVAKNHQRLSQGIDIKDLA